MSPIAAATVRVSDRRGRVLARKRLGTVRTGWPTDFVWRCHLLRGTNDYAILATDLAGNEVATPGMNKLTVRRATT